ncbi:MAG: hypothetical protein COV34_02295, partial [Candidatus Zambryskibacteria bacterium CG10_big_fil_rev_8_21_14_0_10_42_12]
MWFQRMKLSFPLMLFLVGIIVLLAVLVLAVAPTIEFVSPTPANGSTQSSDSIYVNLSTTSTGDHYSFVDFDNSLVGWYRMDSANSSTVFDESGYGNNGTLTGNAFINESGYWGNGSQFDGNGDYISLGTPTSLDISKNTFFITAWVNPSTASAFAGIIKRGAPTSGGALVSYSMYVYTSNRIQFYIANGSTSNTAVITATNSIPLDTWTFVACGVNDSSYLQCYINGALSGNTPQKTITGTYSAGSFSAIGASRSSADFFNGSIDEVLFFNRSLSEGEILALYNASATKYEHNFTGLSLSDHIFTGYGVDLSGDKNETGERIVTLVDTTPPSVTINVPENTTYTSSSISFNVSLNENGTAWFSLDGGVNNLTMDTVDNQNFNYTNSSIADGSYTFNAYANDTAGNNNYTESITFNVNTLLPPTFSNFQVSPPNGTAYSQGAFYEFNVTVSGTLGTVWIEFNGTNYTGEVLSRGDSIYSFNRTGLTSGDYSYIWWANNTAGILNSSGTKNYNVAISGCDCGSTNSSDPCIGNTINLTVIAETPNGGTAVNATFTWEFNSGGNPTYCGKFASEDYWVAPKDGLTVQITNITSNGSISADVDPIMESMGLLDGSNSYGNYNSSENIIPNLPLNYSGINSIVVAVQRNETSEGNCGASAIVGECVDAYQVLTVLQSLPENNGNETIRPNVVGETKEILTFSDFNFSKLPSESFLTGTDNSGFESIRLRWAHSTEVFGLFYRPDSPGGYSEGGRAFRSHILIDDYGGGVASQWNSDMMTIFSDDNSLSEKQSALAAMISYGLDLYHGMYDAPEGTVRYWGVGATQHPGKFMPPVFMSSLLINQTYANNLRLVGPNMNNNNFSDYTGPHELAQVHEGVNFPVWGDIKFDSLEEEDYWQNLLRSQCYDGVNGTCSPSATGGKNQRDPYGYIDGPANQPGTSYIVSSAGGQRGMVAIMHLIPEICEIVNYDPLIEYTIRLNNSGLLTVDDPCVTPDSRENYSICSPYPSGANCSYYEVTWGPDTSNPGQCITTLTSPYTKVGRFTELNGTKLSYTHTSSQIESNWDTILATSTCKTDPSSNLNNPSNGSTVTSSSQTFSASFVDSRAISNATFHLWNSTGSLINQTTINITGTDNSSSLSVSLPYEGTFYWNYEVVDDTSNSEFNNTNYTLTYTASSSSSSTTESSSGGGGDPNYVPPFYTN